MDASGDCGDDMLKELYPDTDIPMELIGFLDDEVSVRLLSSSDSRSYISSTGKLEPQREIAKCFRSKLPTSEISEGRKAEGCREPLCSGQKEKSRSFLKVAARRDGYIFFFQVHLDPIRYHHLYSYLAHRSATVTELAKVLQCF